MEGLAGFPMLKNLTIGLHMDAPTRHAENPSNDLYRLFNHVPALETLRIYGTPTAALEIAQTLKPLEYTLKRLSLHWDFRHRGINPEDLITVKTVLGKIGALRLLVLEDLNLRLELETAIYQRDDTRHLAHRSVAKTLKSLLDDIIHDYDTNLPRLQRLEFEVSMIIYEKPKAYTPSAGKLYQAKAIRVLTRYLRGFEDNGKFNFVFNLNVYRRCTDRYCYHDSVSGEIRDDDDGGDGQDDVHDEDDATADEDSYESPLGESFYIPLFLE
ncbi:hypothetical protein BJ165DRAFT_1464264 [Panaeolus papilionaceus]|nr:hypothetical protein BJ165DRAFT_1464264 [Panaeolus papilionaceus]